MPYSSIILTWRFNSVDLVLSECRGPVWFFREFHTVLLTVKENGTTLAGTVLMLV